MKPESKYSRYLLVLGIAYVVCQLLVVLGNWLVDPYAIYGSPRISGFNVEKPEAQTHARLYKAWAVSAVKPRAIVLGTSKADVGIDPEHVGFAAAPVYNLSLSAATIYESARFFQHAHNNQPLSQALLFLDLVSFNPFNKSQPSFDEAFLSINYDGSKKRSSAISVLNSTLFSKDAVYSSFTTIRNQHDSNSDVFLPNGRRLERESASDTVKRGYGAAFAEKEREMLHEYMGQPFSFDNLTPADSPFEYYRKIVSTAYRDNIDLRIIIAPYHPRVLEILAVSGLWPAFEDWKRRLVEVAETESLNAGRQPFPVLDFSTYNELTTEEVPVPGDLTTKMRWYVDLVHFSREMGDLVLDKVFDMQMGRELPGNFGVKLTTLNTEQHLLQIRLEREGYRATHPGDIAEIMQAIESLGLD